MPKRKWVKMGRFLHNAENLTRAAQVLEIWESVIHDGGELTRAAGAVHKMYNFCFQFRYWVFITPEYLINRKVAEAVSRSLSPP